MQNTIFEPVETVETEEDEQEDFKVFNANQFLDMNAIQEDVENESEHDDSVAGINLLHESSESSVSQESSQSGTHSKNDTESQSDDNDEDEDVEVVLIANRVAESQEQMIRQCAIRMVSPTTGKLTTLC